MSGWAGRARRALLGALVWCVLCGISPQAQAQAQAVCPTTVMGNIAGACLWLKADDGADTISAPEGAWLDRSGNGKDLRNGVDFELSERASSLPIPASPPSWIAGSATTGMNFNPVVSFDGAYQRVARKESTIGTSVSQIHVFFVSRERLRRQTALFYHWYRGNDGESRMSIHWAWGDGNKIYWDRGICCSAPAGRNQANAPFVAGVANLGLTTYSAKRNRADLVVNAKTLDVQRPRPPAQFSTINLQGSLTVVGAWYNGDIPELLEFNRNLTSAERTRVQSYLALKYGLTLDRTGLGNAYTSGSGSGSGTSVYSDGAHWNSIIGIGRDSVTGLDQRVSRSTQKIGTGDLWVAPGDSPLTLATTSDFTSANNDSSRTPLANGQYLVLGDNNGALTFDPATKRLGRVWRAQNTDAVGPVYLGFDTAKFPEGKPGYVLINAARYPLGQFTQGGVDVFTPVASSGSATPVPVTIPNGASITLLEACEGTALGIADACVWLRADRGVRVNDQWADQSGMGNTAAVNGTTTMTTLNFNPAVSYSGGAGHTFAVAADVARRYTFLGVARLTGTKNQRVFSAVGSNRLFGYHGDGQNKWYERPTTGVDSDLGWKYPPGGVGHEPAQTRPMLYTLKRADGIASFKSNGRTLRSDAAIDTSGAYRVSLANGGAFGGAFATNDESSDVSIPEFFSFKRALSDAEIDRIESYLALKYGFTLGTAAEPRSYVNSTNQTVWTANSVYHNRVFGLGRDGGSQGLDQRVSKSTDHTLDDASSSILTLATSADFTSANGGDRPALQPGQYLVLGDNNGDVATLGAATAEQFGRRIGRVWRAQNTGSVGAVYLGFDPTLLETNFPQNKRVFLLVSTDADFKVANTTRYALGRVTVGSKAVLTPVTDIGQTEPLAITIPNGSYITLGQESVCTGTVMNIPDACLWLKADDGGLTPGGTVGTWQDRSGNGKDLTGENNPSVVAGSNTTGMNFNPVVRFNGVNQAVVRNESTLGTDVSEVNIFFVSRETARQDSILLSHSSYGDPQRLLLHWPWGDGNLAWDRGPCCEYPRPSSLANSAAPFPEGVSNLGLVTNSVETSIVENVVNARTLPKLEESKPGIRITGTFLDTTRIAHGDYRLKTGELEGRYPSVYPYKGDIPEFLEFKRNLTPTQRTRVQSYLALKYGLTLDRTGLGNAYTSGSGTSVYSDGAYWNSIIGIGRDGVTGLDQRVSRSTQKIGTGTTWVAPGDSPLTIATSADFTSANPGTRHPLANGQYLVLGDNDGALTLDSATKRIGRVWRAQNTGVHSVFLGLAAATLRGFDPRYPRYLFVESGAGADGSFPVGRTSTYVLSNTLSGLADYWVPVADGAALAVNIPNGAFLSYGTLAEPQLSLTVQSRGGVDRFSFSGTNGFVASSATTEVEMQPVVASPAMQTLSAPDADIVITVTTPAAGWSLETASCIDRQAATSGNPRGAVLGRVSAGNQFTIPAAQAKASADLHCTLVVRYDLGSTLNTISGRVFIDNGAGVGGAANDGHINGAEAGRSGAALRLTDCGATTHAFASGGGDGSYSLQVPRAVANGTLCVEQTLTDDYRVTQGGLDASGLDASGVTLDTAAAQSNRWRFNYAGANVQNLHIGNVPSSRLLLDGTRVGIAGSTVDFPHRWIAGTAGTLTFEMSDASPAAGGWSEVLYRDANCDAQLDAGEPLLGGSLTVTADENVCVIVRQFVPTGLYEGATRQFQLQATLNWANAAPRSETLTNRDDTQVSDQALRLYKEVRNVTADALISPGHESWTTSNSAKPGETLEYRTTFTNLAPEPITKLEIYDATPNYTTLVSAECPAASSLPTGLTCVPLSSTASPPTKPANGGTGPLRWHFNGPLLGGASGAVKYQVKVNE